MKRKNGKVGIIITIIILILLVILTNNKNDILGKITSPFTKVVRYTQGGFENFKNKISKNEEYFITMDNLKKENEDLKRENEELKEINSKLSILESENKTLKEYESLTNIYADRQCIPGYVVQRDFSNYSKIVVINVGRDDGVEAGMTVVAEQGLVGYVISAESNSAKVQTIVDTANAVSGYIADTDKSLVTRGQLDSDSEIKGTYIDNDVTIDEGDLIVTSGIGGIYPRNIPIGKVKEIVNTKNKSNRYVYVETAVDFNHMSSILVIKN